MIQLIILNENDEWRELDIKDVDIVLHKAFQNLEDPSTIESAYTLNVNLPFTKHNNEILGDIYTLDFSLPPGNYEFDQRKRYKFNLLHDNEVLFNGDFVLNNIIINSDQSKNIYNATLYDEMFSVFKKLDYEISNPPETDDSAIATYAGKNKYYNINALDFQASPKNATRTWECGAQYNSLMYSDSVERLYIPNDDELFKYGGFIPTDLWDKDFHYSTLYYPYVPGGPSLGGTEGELYSFNSFVSNSIYTEKQAETWKVYH